VVCPRKIEYINVQKLPMSSLQMFTGEDLKRDERIRQQKRELKQWSEYTVQEKVCSQTLFRKLVF